MAEYTGVPVEVKNIGFVSFPYKQCLPNIVLFHFEFMTYLSKIRNGIIIFFYA